MANFLDCGVSFNEFIFIELDHLDSTEQGKFHFIVNDRFMGVKETANDVDLIEKYVEEERAKDSKEKDVDEMARERGAIQLDLFDHNGRLELLTNCKDIDNDLIIRAF